MYSEAFCKVYNEFGWNYFPEAFGEMLLKWISIKQAKTVSMLDIGCGTGVLCEIMHDAGIRAAGMDLSEGMIEIAKKRSAEKGLDIHYEVANMITYRPKQQFDLVTCTGDAMNHILDLKDVKTVLDNVYSYLTPGGYLIFDILNEKEVGDGEPIELDYSDTVKAQLQITQGADRIVTLQVSVYENGELKIQEQIHEIVHDKDVICRMLEDAGFEDVICQDRLLESEGHGTTWFVIARKTLG